MHELHSQGLHDACERVTGRHCSIAGKRILITGGSSGIGLATVRLLAQEGSHILTLGRDSETLDAALQGLTDLRGSLSGMAADVISGDDLDRVFAAMDQMHGGIDILVACAALGADPLHEMAEEDWRYVVETNLMGYLACAQRALARMREQGSGHLLFVGSISAEIKAVGESVYSATKAGIQAFAETLRKEVAGDNIRVSVIQPGSVDTPMQECDEAAKQQAVTKGEMLPPEEVAEAILFVLTRSAATDIVTLRIEPLLQKTA